MRRLELDCGMLGLMKPLGVVTEQSEQEILARARRGDRRAFEDLVRSHLPRVWRVVWKVLRHHEDTEDVVQEVFLAAHRALPEFRGDSRFSTWLHRIAVNRALNHLNLKGEKIRRETRSLESLEEGQEGRAEDGERALFEAGPPSPLQSLEMSELKRRLTECLSRIPGAWRTVLTLKIDGNHSYEEMAGILGLALGTVRSRLARARLALRRCLAEESI